MQDRPKHPSYYNRPKSSLQLMSQMAKFTVPDKDHAKKAHEVIQQQRAMEQRKEERENRYPARTQIRAGAPLPRTRTRPQRVKLADYAFNPDIDPTKSPPKPKSKEANRSLFSNCVTEVFAPIDEIKNEQYHSERKVWPTATSSNRNNCLIGGDGSDVKWKSTAHHFDTKEWGLKDRTSNKKNFDSRDPKNMINPLTNEQFGWPEDVMATSQPKKEVASLLHAVAASEEQNNYYDSNNGDYDNGEFYDDCDEYYEENGEYYDENGAYYEDNVEYGEADYYTDSYNNKFS